jgi:hypothetical protein
MSQTTDLQMPTTGPVSPLAYTNELNDILDAIATHNKGTSAPSNPVQAMFWIDDTANPIWTLKFYDGTDWIALLTVDSTNNTVNVAKLDSAQAWSKQQYSSVASLTDAANIDWNLDTQQVAKVTLADNRTMNAPSNLQDGAFYSLTVKQDATGSRTLTWNSVFKFPSGTAPTLTIAANAIDKLTFDSDGTNMHLVGISLDLK